MTTTDAVRYGSTIVAALEDAWALVRSHHPEVRPAVMVTGRAAHGSHGQYGHFHACAWIPGTTGWPVLDEVFISAEMIAKGGRAVLGALLHEACHSLAYSRGVNDVSRKAVRYHTRIFAEHAAEVGLVPPKQAAPGYGWSTSAVTDQCAARYADVVAVLTPDHLAAADPYIPQRQTALAALRSQALRDIRAGRNLILTAKDA